MATDLTLIERIARGDRHAVSLCIEQYSGLVWSLARRLLVNRSDAEEGVQDVFIELWRKAKQYDPSQSSEATFVSMVARRRLIDRARKEQRQPPMEPLMEINQGLSLDGHRAIEASAETQQIIKLIESMTPEQQTVLRLSTWLGMSHQAIAERTELPLGTVKSHLRRGLNQIRERLGQVESRGKTKA